MNYWVAVAGQQYGPFPLGELRRMITGRPRRVNRFGVGRGNAQLVAGVGSAAAGSAYVRSLRSASASASTAARGTCRAPSAGRGACGASDAIPHASTDVCGRASAGTRGTLSRKQRRRQGTHSLTLRRLRCMPSHRPRMLRTIQARSSRSRGSLHSVARTNELRGGQPGTNAGSGSARSALGPGVRAGNVHP